MGKKKKHLKNKPKHYSVQVFPQDSIFGKAVSVWVNIEWAARWRTEWVRRWEGGREGRRKGKKGRKEGRREGGIDVRWQDKGGRREGRREGRAVGQGIEEGKRWVVGGKDGGSEEGVCVKGESSGKVSLHKQIREENNSLIEEESLPSPLPPSLHWPQADTSSPPIPAPYRPLHSLCRQWRGETTSSTVSSVNTFY